MHVKSADFWGGQLEQSLGEEQDLNSTSRGHINIARLLLSKALLQLPAPKIGRFYMHFSVGPLVRHPAIVLLRFSGLLDYFIPLELPVPKIPWGPLSNTLLQLPTQKIGRFYMHFSVGLLARHPAIFLLRFSGLLDYFIPLELPVPKIPWGPLSKALLQLPAPKIGRFYMHFSVGPLVRHPAIVLLRFSGLLDYFIPLELPVPKIPWGPLSNTLLQLPTQKIGRFYMHFSVGLLARHPAIFLLRFSGLLDYFIPLELPVPKIPWGPLSKALLQLPAPKIGRFYMHFSVGPLVRHPAIVLLRFSGLLDYFIPLELPVPKIPWGPLSNTLLQLPTQKIGRFYMHFSVGLLARHPAIFLLRFSGLLKESARTDNRIR